MTKQWKNIQQNLFFITILVLILGMININLTLIGLSCFILPFYYYFKYKDKIWCKYICPRSGFFTKVIGKINIGLKPPKWLTSKKTRYGVLTYFMLFMSFAVISTILVALGISEAKTGVKFLVLFNIPYFPQLIDITVPSWVFNLSYSIYSMLLTSTLVGVTLGVLFRPKTWCAVCPVNTLTPIKKQVKQS